MKKFLLAIGLVLILALPAHAQWGRGMVTGRRILSRDGITTADSAFSSKVFLR